MKKELLVKYMMQELKVREGLLTKLHRKGLKKREEL